MAHSRPRRSEGLDSDRSTTTRTTTAGALDATLWPLLGKAVTLVVRADEAVRSATNPEWGGSPILSSYQPINGAVGELSTGSITLMGSGPLTRTT